MNTQPDLNAYRNAARNDFVEEAYRKARNGERVNVAQLAQEHKNNAQSAAGAERICTKCVTGPLYEVEAEDKFQIHKLKAFITTLKFTFSMAGIILFAQTQTGSIHFTSMGYALLAWNFLRLGYVFFIVCVHCTGSEVGSQLCVAIICKTCCEISCNCCGTSPWAILLTNMAFYMIYYSVSIILFVIFGALIDTTDIFSNKLGIGMFFAVFCLHVISLILEIIRFFKLKKRYTTVIPL